MNKKRKFLTRLEAANRLGLTDAATNPEKAAKLGAKLAVRIGGVVREGNPDEVLHSQIAQRIVQEGRLGPYVEGWTCSENEVPE